MARFASAGASRHAQRGAALLAMLAVVVLTFSYMLVDQLASANRAVVTDQEQNARVLSRAKQALVGWMTINAAGTDANPGRLPCPEAPGYYGDPAQEGIAAGSCTPPNNVGRLPWRTLGLDRVTDGSGEPLWYAVSPGWSLPGAGTSAINSDTTGQLTVDGAANDAVAVIVAPGTTLAVQAGGGCTAWSQNRPVTGTPDLRDYLECGNASGSFVSSVPGRTFNDQLLRVTAADVLPAVEAAIAHRMEREIAPALRTVYGAAQWGTSAANPLFPYPAPFGNPGSSNYQGVAATSSGSRPQGLLPFTSSDPACGADPRCSTSFVSWNTGVGPNVSLSGLGALLTSSCSFPNASTVRCTGTYAGVGTLTLRMSARVNNLAMSMRTLAPANMTVEYGLVAYGSPGPGTSASGTFNSNGSANLVLNAEVPGLIDGLGLPLAVQFRLTADLGVIADHPLLDPTDPTTGWFVRNEWFRQVYYAASVENTAYSLPSLGCTTGSNCLRMSFPTTTWNVRSLLVLAGRSINGSARPSATLANYLEFQNGDGGVIYEQRPVSRVVNATLMSPFNDRVILVDAN